MLFLRGRGGDVKWQEAGVEDRVSTGHPSPLHLHLLPSPSYTSSSSRDLPEVSLVLLGPGVSYCPGPFREDVEPPLEGVCLLL